MEIKHNKIILRDTEEKDIKDYVRWNTVETEWQNWDEPWKNSAVSQEVAEETARLMLYNLKFKQKFGNDNAIRKHMEILINVEKRTHIGWVSRYFINENYIPAENGKYVAVGVDIVPPDIRGQGYGYDALTAFIDYLLEKGEKEIYTQTWSGNERMINLAKKAGFVEYDREIGIRTVNGKKYDEIMFVRRPRK